MMFSRFTRIFKRKNPLLQLNNVGNKGKKIVHVWKKNSNSILNSLPVETDPDFCLDGMHLFYARDAQSFGLDKTVNLILKFFSKRLSSHATCIKFSFDVTDALKKKFYLEINCTQRYQDNSYGLESLIIIRTGESEFKGCISTDNNVYYFE